MPNQTEQLPHHTTPITKPRHAQVRPNKSRHFASFNPVEAKVIFDRETGRSKGFGFVTFPSPSSHQTAAAPLRL